MRKAFDSPYDQAENTKKSSIKDILGLKVIKVEIGSTPCLSASRSHNNRFGSLRRSDRLGIIWNDQMDDFSIPGATNYFGFAPTEENFVAGGKRPLSSMSPLVVYNRRTKQVKASVGA